MNIKLTTLILTLSDLLSACNYGNPLITPTNLLQNNVSESSLNQLLKIQPLQLVVTPSITPKVFGYKDIKIGSGYNPATGQVYHLSEPNLAKFQYLANGDSIQSAIDGCSGNEFFVRAEEIGKVVSTSSQDIFKANLGVAANYGLYKMKLAGAYEKTRISSEGTAAVTREAAGLVSCDIYAKIDGAEASPTAAKYMSQAFLAASPAVAELINQIRTAKTATAKRSAITNFYTTFGPYVITKATLSEIAAAGINLTQKIATTEQQEKGNFAMEFSAPFVAGNAGLEFANGTKVSTKDWDISDYHYEYPQGTTLATSIKAALEEISAFKKDGIIDYANLQPKEIVIDPITKPDLSKINYDSDTATKLKKATADYNDITAKLKLINAELVALSTETMTTANLTYLQEYITPYLITLAAIDTSYLTREQSAVYATLVATKDLLSGINSLISSIIATCAEAKPCSTKDLLYTKVKTYLKAVNLEQKTTEQQQTADANIAKQHKAFIAKYPTYGAYVKETIYLAGQDGADSSEFNKDPSKYDNWYSKMLKDNPSKIKHYKNDYNQKSGSDSESLTLHLKQQVIHKLNLKTVLKSTNSLMAEAADAAIYKNKLITDFKLVAWANIFPELNYQFITDDSEETNQNIAQIALNKYFRMYRYLANVATLDAQINSLFIKETVGNGLGIYNKLALIKQKVDEVAATVPTADNQKISFSFAAGQNYNYDLYNDDDVSKLLQQIDGIESASAMLHSEWGEITQLLMDNELISRYGSFAGIQPIYSGVPSNGFRLLTESTTRIDSPSVILSSAEDNWLKRSPLRMVLQIFSNIFGTSQQELPHGIYMTTRNEMKTTEGVAQEELFKRKMIGLNGAPGAIVPSGFFDDIGINQEYRVNGIVPIVLSTTQLDGETISGLGIIDSLGHIWGINASNDGNHDKFSAQEDTLKYALDLSKNIASNPAFPAYALIPVTGDYPSIMEFRWNLMGYDLDNTDLFKIYVGLSAINPTEFASQNLQSLNKDSDFSKMQQKLLYNSYEEEYPNEKMLSIYNSGGVYLAAAKSAQAGIATCAIDGQSDTNLLFNHNAKALWAPFPGMNICSLRYYAPNGSKSNHGNSLGLKNITQYRLIIAPITKNVLTAIANSLKNDTKHKPLLPVYSFMGAN